MKERIIIAIITSLVVSFVVMIISVGGMWILKNKLIWNSFNTRLSIVAFILFFIMALIGFEEKK